MVIPQRSLADKAIYNGAHPTRQVIHIGRIGFLLVLPTSVAVIAAEPVRVLRSDKQRTRQQARRSPWIKPCIAAT